MVKAKAWIFVLNNYDDEKMDKLKGLFESHFDYLCYGKEVGAEGTPHLQGVLHLKVRKELRTLKNLLGPEYHFEQKKGTWQRAVDYCKKGDQPKEEWEELGTAGPNYGLNADITELGEFPAEKGERTDVQQAKSIIDEGGSMLQVAEECFESFCRYERAFRSYKRMKTTSRDWEMEVYILWGKPGTGKTRWANELSESVYFLETPRGSECPWWDNYDGEEVVVIDDFYGWLKWSFLLKLLDRYKFQVPIKGGFMEFTSKKIVITSNASPATWYQYSEKMDKEALKRRITEVWHFPGGVGEKYLIPNKF